MEDLILRFKKKIKYEKKRMKRGRIKNKRSREGRC